MDLQYELDRCREKYALLEKMAHTIEITSCYNSQCTALQGSDTRHAVVEHVNCENMEACDSCGEQFCDAHGDADNYKCNDCIDRK